VKPSKSAAATANRVRIIGGEHRSRVLRFSPTLGLRPTPDRVRETLFNWLGQDLTGRHCLDLFAGSGALGFEAVSRGAARVVMVERDPQSCRALRENQALLGTRVTEVLQIDALEFLRQAGRPFHIAFLDPPYAYADTPGLLSALRAHLAADAMVYREGAEFLDPPAGWTEYRRARAGAVHYQLLILTSES